MLPPRTGPKHTMRTDRSSVHAHRIQEIHGRLLDCFGHPVGWWPAASPFEVILGAVLVQHTRWAAVEKALARLESETGCDPELLLAVPPDRLESWLRPAGCHRQKARRVRALCTWWCAEEERGDLTRLPTRVLREQLLAQEGIGPETADAILLYAFRRMAWIIDQSALRLYSRLGLCGDRAADFQERVLPYLPRGVVWRQEHHALVVLHGQRFCRAEPVCLACPLSRLCRWAQRVPPRRRAIRIARARNPR